MAEDELEEYLSDTEFDPSTVDDSVDTVRGCAVPSATPELGRDPPAPHRLCRRT